MKITTKSGTVYDIRDGHCVRTGSEAGGVPGEYAFKVRTVASVANGVETVAEAQASAALGNPIEVGKRMYLNGSFGWFISTPIVSIVEDEPTACNDGTHHPACDCGAEDPDDVRDAAREYTEGGM